MAANESVNWSDLLDLQNFDGFREGGTDQACKREEGELIFLECGGDGNAWEEGPSGEALASGRVREWN